MFDSERVSGEIATRHTQVLTMEWVDGTRLVDGAELAVYTGDDRAGTRLVDALVQCSLRQMLDSGFFHADPCGPASRRDAFTPSS